MPAFERSARKYFSRPIPPRTFLELSRTSVFEKKIFKIFFFEKFFLEKISGIRCLGVSWRAKTEAGGDDRKIGFRRTTQAVQLRRSSSGAFEAVPFLYPCPISQTWFFVHSSFLSLELRHRPLLPRRMLHMVCVLCIACGRVWTAARQFWLCFCSAFGGDPWAPPLPSQPSVFELPPGRVEGNWGCVLDIMFGLGVLLDFPCCALLSAFPCKEHTFTALPAFGVRRIVKVNMVGGNGKQMPGSISSTCLSFSFFPVLPLPMLKPHTRKEFFVFP